MSVEDPGELTVTCDECGNETIDVATEQTSDAGLPTFGIDREALTDAGWKIEGSDLICPDCQTEDDD